MTVSLIDCGSSKVPDLIKILKELDVKIKQVSLEQANQKLSLLKKSDALIISGGPSLFTDPNLYKSLMEKFKFLVNDDLPPILGICLGHQALGLIDNAKIFLGKEIRRREEISIIKKHEIFADLPEKFFMMEDHCEGISCPDSYEIIARSAHYEVEAMICHDKKRLGLQFHPEASGPDGKILIKRFLRFFRV